MFYVLDEDFGDELFRWFDVYALKRQTMANCCPWNRTLKGKSGRAKQYGRSGKVIGTYRFVHGTGYEHLALGMVGRFRAGVRSPQLQNGAFPMGTSGGWMPISAVLITNALVRGIKYHGRAEWNHREIASRIPEVLDPWRSGYQTSVPQSSQVRQDSAALSG